MATTKRSRSSAKRRTLLVAPNSTASKLMLALVVGIVVVTGFTIVRHSFAATIDSATWAPTGSGAWYFDRTNITGGTVADYQQREQQFGRKFDGHMFYMHNQVVATDFDVPSWSINTDHVPFVVLSWGITPPSTVMNDVASGSQDANIKFFADNVKSKLAAGKVFIRPFYEFNIAGNPYNANNNPTLFKQAWIHFVTVFKGEGVTNVKFIWEPNAVASSTTLNPVPFYPGAGYVDWIGIDTYPKNTYKTVTPLVEGSLFDWYNTFKTYGKPLAITEIGIQAADHYGAGTPTRAQWWSSALANMKALPAIKMFEYFDSNGGAYPWRYDNAGTAAGDSGAQALAAAANFSKDCYMNVLSPNCGGNPGSPSPSSPPPTTPPPTTPPPTTPPPPPVSDSVQPPTPSPTPCPPLPVSASTGIVTATSNAPVTGAYNVWARMKSPDGAANSFLMQVDDTYCNILVGGGSMAPGTWTWVNYQNADPTRVLSMNLSSGTHKITAVGNDIDIDRLIFTGDPACVPVGNGNNCTTITNSPSMSVSPSSPPPSPSSPPPPPPSPSTQPPSPSQSPVVSGTADVPDIGDATVKEDTPNTNYSSQTKMQLGAAKYRALLKFDTRSVLPAGAVPTSARLQVFVTNTAVTTGQILAHHESNSWLAPDVTWNNQPAWETAAIGRTATTPVGQHFTSIPIPLNQLNLGGYSSLGLNYSITTNGDTEIASHEAQNIPTLHIDYSTGGGGGGGDTQAPTAPGNLTANYLSPVDAGSGAVSLKWTASTDNVGVDHYVIMRDGVVVGSVAGSVLAYTDGTVLPGTTYTYTASAYDAAGNQSPASNSASVTTPQPPTTDNQPPTAPSNLVAAVPAGSTDQVNLSWGASTDNVGVAGYRIFRNGTQVAQVNSSATSYGEAGLSPGTYSYTVQAFDAAANVSPASNTATVTIQPPPTSPPPTSPPPPPPGPLGSTTPCLGTQYNAPTTYQHVIWIWMENHTYSQVIGTAAAPYMTSLTQKCGTATKYASNGSPSLPNYIAATSGANQGISDDAPPCLSGQTPCHTVTVDNLFRQVRATGRTEKSYQESMTANCQQGSANPYAVKHNPEAYYSGGTDHSVCLQNNIPMGTTSAGNFLTDLNAGTLPSFSFITPNLCNDTHDCATATGDAWLKNWVPKILDSNTYKAGNTAVFIVYDEYTDMPTMFIAPSVKPGTVSATAFSHFSLLRTTEEMLGIPTHLGGAAGANSLRSPFSM